MGQNRRWRAHATTRVSLDLCMTTSTASPRGRCARCATPKLAREPLATETAIALVFVCPEHGLAYAADPFA